MTEKEKDRYADQWAELDRLPLPTPVPLLPDTAPATPYPLDTLTGEMRAAVEAIVEHEQVPAAIAGQTVIGAATYLAQTRVNAWHPKGRPGGAPCSLFMLSLFGSGEGKSSARRLAFKTIDEAEKDARTRYRLGCAEIMTAAEHLKGKARDEFLIANPLPPDPKTQYSDATFEPLAGDFIRGKPAAIWDTDEGGQMLGGASLKAETVAATLCGLTKGFDDGYFERTRSKGNLEGSGVAYNRRLSIHLLAQPVAVAEALASPLLTNQGFLARFMFAAPDSLAGSRFISLASLERSSYADPRLQAYWARCEEIAASPEHIDPQTGEVNPPVLQLDAKARQIWVDFSNEVEAETGALGKFASLRPFANRGAEQALRLASVLGCFEGIEEIDGTCMLRACALVRYSLSEWQRYTDANAANPDLKRAAELTNWLRDSKRAAHWQVFDRTKAGKSWPESCRPAKVRDKVLSILVKHHHLLTSDDKHFRINPLAEIADAAESLQACDFTAADDLRKAAETVAKPATTGGAALMPPQTSANPPQAEDLQSRDLPQNPQYPQSATPADSKGEQPWGLSL
jgi:hypothetical protein